MDKFDAMTVNERLFEAGLLDDYDRAKAAGDETKLREILARVDLRRDANGMNWSVDNAQN